MVLVLAAAGEVAPYVASAMIRPPPVSAMVAGCRSSVAVAGAAAMMTTFEVEEVGVEPLLCMQSMSRSGKPHRSWDRMRGRIGVRTPGHVPACALWCPRAPPHATRRSARGQGGRAPEFPRNHLRGPRPGHPGVTRRSFPLEKFPTSSSQTGGTLTGTCVFKSSLRFC